MKLKDLQSPISSGDMELLRRRKFLLSKVCLHDLEFQLNKKKIC